MSRVPPTSVPPGYSLTPLAKKLGIREGSTVALVGAPREFTIPHLPPGVAIRRSARGQSDVTLWFVKSAVELGKRIGEMALRADKGALWICWPKLASGVSSDVTESSVRTAALASGLVDFKIGAIDQTWSGLRFAVAKGATGKAVVRVLRVFTDEAGRNGNALGVVDGALVDSDDRQRVAFELGFSETIFIDDHATGELRIFTPRAELPLAGHPLVGAAFFIRAERARKTKLRPATGPDAADVIELRPPGGLVRAWADSDERTWIEAPLATLPDWALVELGSPAEIDGLSGPVQPDHDHAVYWAWIRPGAVRMRCFAPLFGIAEDEATGSAALRLAAQLGQPIEIRQGRGSVLSARPIDADRAAVGGWVVEDEPLALP